MQAFYYLVTLFLILVILLFVGSKLPITGNYKLMAVMSGSMEPVIKTGSIVIVKPAKDYKIGEIVSFGPVSKTKPPTTHRIVEAEIVGGEVYYTMKGDANAAPDAVKVARKDVLGRVLFSLPFFGYAVDFVRKPIGFIMIIVLPALVLILDEFRKIWREMKKRRAGKGTSDCQPSSE